MVHGASGQFGVTAPLSVRGLEPRTAPVHAPTQPLPTEEMTAHWMNLTMRQGYVALKTAQVSFKLFQSHIVIFNYLNRFLKKMSCKICACAE